MPMPAFAVAMLATSSLGLITPVSGAQTPASPSAQPPAQAPTTSARVALSIGSPAPTLEVGQWIKGDSIATIEAGKVYVVAFWQTDSAVCGEALVHLSRLQEQYKDAATVVAGISNESPETLAQFLRQADPASGKTWDQVVSVRLGADPDKSCWNDYVVAAGQEKFPLPCAFIIGRDQRIDWIGNPLPRSGDQLDRALEAVVRGAWDRATYRSEWDQSQARKRAALQSAAQQEARKRELEALNKAVAARDWKSVVEISDRLLAIDPQDVDTAEIKFRAMAVGLGQADEAYVFLKGFIQPLWNDAAVLNRFAWVMVADKDLKDRNIILALGYAMRANKLAGGVDPAILDTLARCYYLQGMYTEAVNAQAQAVEHAPSDDEKQRLSQTLETYKQEAEKHGG